ncbi:MAG TPA: tRNA dihydrouridine synthase DusB [Saprospiraceae bacterium]|nr:tRNA dihydrouridine synthase DusB [Saprospiraceae bacterium]HRO07970.1 tRNA dihydrouridine synthase DusB [Saprospiraceae bacterium]HRP41465.1 tRNA dihydrouridine synthase DusB [Saprospiraceae bacterium]
MVKIGTTEIGEFPLLLAPMEDVSDPPFRSVCKDQGADLMYTEFISVEGLIRDADKSIQKLDIYDEERPIGIQIFGADIDSMSRAAEIVEAAKPELLDINFGCPVKKVVCKMAGAGILQDIPKMVRLTEKIVKSTSLPVTVKTRLGWDEESMNIEEVAERLQDVGIQALAIHGRTRKQMYKGEADWTLIGKVKNNPRIHIPIFGNGDIDTPEKTKLYKERYGVDGIMIGRASIGYPWIFRDIKSYLNHGFIPEQPDISERVEVAKKHLTKSIEWKGERVGVVEMRRHYTNYFRGLPDIKDFRMKLVSEMDKDILFEILDEIRNFYQDVLV